MTITWFLVYSLTAGITAAVVFHICRRLASRLEGSVGPIDRKRTVRMANALQRWAVERSDDDFSLPATAQSCDELQHEPWGTPEPSASPETALRLIGESGPNTQEELAGYYVPVRMRGYHTGAARPWWDSFEPAERRRRF